MSWKDKEGRTIELLPLCAVIGMMTGIAGPLLGRWVLETYLGRTFGIIVASIVVGILLIGGSALIFWGRRVLHEFRHEWEKDE